MKQLILNSILAIFILLNISGCSKSKKNVTQVKVPTWYLNAPSNTPIHLYGTGEASSLNQAKTNALKNMSENLVVTVQSSINTITKASGKTYSKNIIKDIKLEAKKITFSNYKVKKAIQSSNSFFALVSVNRNELFIQKQKEFKLLDNKIKNNKKNLQDKAKLEQIYILEKMKPSINEAKNTAFVLYAINNDFNYQIYHKEYNNHINTLNNLKNNLSLKITSNTKDSLYKQYLIGLLNQNNYKVSEDAQDVNIKILNNIRYSFARGWHIAKVSTTLNIMANDKDISNHIINTVGRSSSNKQNALVSSAYQFNKKIKKLGLHKILFQ